MVTVLLDGSGVRTQKEKRREGGEGVVVFGRKRCTSSTPTLYYINDYIVHYRHRSTAKLYHVC